MLNSTEIQARKLIIEQIEKMLEKYRKKADKEIEKRDNAYVIYQGEKYYTDIDLQDAYGCDAFSSSTYDKLLDKLNKARGKLDQNEFTPTEMLIYELDKINTNLKLEIAQSNIEQKRKAEHDKRAAELSGEGYSFREIETIISNEELMRYE